MEVWIAGLGCVSSIGMNVEENLHSLLNAKSGVGFATVLQTRHKDNLPVCEIKQTNDSLADLVSMPHHLPRTAYLSALAAKEAIQDADIDINSYKVGFLSGNTIGGMDSTEHFYADFLKDKTTGKLRDVVHHECGSVTELVADFLNIKRYVSTISTACSSSANTIIHGARLIKHGLLDIVVAGGADALCQFTLNGFNTLMILDTEPCKPFDANRRGLNLGEGAAYVVLVSERVRQAMSKIPYSRLAGYANANDAFHQTASSAEGNGNYYAMKEAFEMSGLKHNDISYINAHGTGTANNDSSEGIAIGRLFSNHVPPVSSTKANTGHTLGASGSIEAVYSCLSIRHGLIFPNLRFDTKIEEHSFSPNAELITTANIDSVMSNSFGFGGNCSSLIFSKP